MASSIKHLHFVGIAGSLMSGLAQLAIQKGYAVSGSDVAFYPPMGDAARAMNIPLFEGYNADVNRRAADCYIIGNAISRGNPLLESILSNRRPYMSAAQWLAENILIQRYVLAVAGTHGKTTTASLLAWLLSAAGCRPGFLLGGIAQNFGTSARLGDGRFFVIEADEYDTAFFDKRPKFLHYRPDIVLLNNIEFDHADIYQNVDEIIRQFHYLLRVIPADGCVIARAGDTNIQKAVDMGIYSALKWFGDSQDNRAMWTWQYDGKRMQVFYKEKHYADFIPPLSGAANRDNITAAFAVAHTAGIDGKEMAHWAEQFRPPLRRLQKIAEHGGVVVYDDFAHHPTAYKSVIEAIKEMHSDTRIIAVFEPRSNTMKLGAFKDNLAAAFANADITVGVGDYPWLKSALSPLGKSAAYCINATETAKWLGDNLQKKDCVVLMSNGDFGGLANALVSIVNKMS